MGDGDFANLPMIPSEGACFDEPARPAVSVIGPGSPKLVAVEARSRFRQLLEFSIYAHLQLGIFYLNAANDLVVRRGAPSLYVTCPNEQIIVSACVLYRSHISMEKLARRATYINPWYVGRS